MTQQGYFRLKNNDETKIEILKDGLYRIKSQLWCYSQNSYYSNCYLYIDGTQTSRSHFQADYSGGKHHHATHHFDIVFHLRTNQEISFSASNAKICGSANDNMVHIEKM